MSFAMDDRNQLKANSLYLNDDVAIEKTRSKKRSLEQTLLLFIFTPMKQMKFGGISQYWKKTKATASKCYAAQTGGTSIILSWQAETHH